MEQPQQQGGPPPQQQLGAVRRDRNVRTPGQRGGHYRRVWSNKLHKFYIKYGKAPQGKSSDSDDNTPNAQRDRSSPDPDTGGNAKGEQPEGGNGKSAQDELLEGFFQILMKNYHAQSDKNPNTIHIDFGSVSPMNGGVRLDPQSGEAEFHIRTEDNTLVGSEKQKVSDDDEVKKTFCYMVATFVVQQFMKMQQGEQQEEPQQKSLVFLSGGQTAVGKQLRKALRDIFFDRLEVNREVRPITPAIPIEKFNELEKNLARLQRPRPAPLDPISKSLATTYEILDTLEKSSRSAKKIWLRNAPYAGTRYGHIGSGSKTAFRRPGRPPGTGSGLTIASAGIRPDLRHDAMPKANAEVSLENWRKHRDLRIGARAKVKHPYTHAHPTWGIITAVGDHGIQITDDEGNVTNIRWEHIKELSPRVENTPQNAFEIARLSIPVMGTSVVRKTDSELLEKLLRKQKIPMNSDVIHHGHGDRDSAYKELIARNAPIDVISATRAEIKPQDEDIKSHLMQSLGGMDLAVNMELLRELPIKQMIEVLHHHLNGQKE